MFTDFLTIRNICAANTIFKKPPEKLVTYTEKVVEHGEGRGEYEGCNTAPYTHRKCAQCDYLLIKQSQKGIVKDIESKAKPYRNSSHIPLQAKISIAKSKTSRERKKEMCKKGYRPIAEQFKHYNDSIKTRFEH